MHRQAAVGHERRIAFLAARVVAVVVDAVRVPGEGGVAEVERVGERASCRSRRGRCAPGSARSPWSSGPAARRGGRSRRTRRPRCVLPACSIVWRMVSTKMSPERPVLGTMSATSAFLTAGSPARRRPMILTRRPAPMRRGIGIGGSTMPLLGWPSGPMSLLAHRLAEEQVNQCGGSSLAVLEAAGIDVEGRRRRAARPSGRYRPRPCAPARSTAAGSPSLRPSSPHRLVPSLLRENRTPAAFSNKEGPAIAGPSMIRKIGAIRSSSTSCTRPAPAGVPRRRPLPT